MASEDRLKARRDTQWWIDSAREEGLEEGMERGRDEGRDEIARKLKARGRPLEEIAEDTGLDLESIKNL